jgi:hypothetical protein
MTRKKEFNRVGNANFLSDPPEDPTGEIEAAA